MSDKAIPICEVPLEFIKLPLGVPEWQEYETEDIFTQNFINFPSDYLYTLGSATPWDRKTFTSLATTPRFELPTQSQFYIAGRDVIRWGGSSDPTEIDMDRYGFTPDLYRGVALMWKAPKSEPHHLSTRPEILTNAPDHMKELLEAIKNGEIIK